MKKGLKISIIYITMFIGIMMLFFIFISYSKQEDKNSRVQRFDKHIRRLASLLKVPGISYAVMENGTILHEGVIGIENLNTRTKVTKKTIFRIASVSKTFAAVLCMQLIDQGKMSLDDPIDKYLPARKYFPSYNNDNPVCIKHLLSHTAEGLPGELYQYNNAHYRLLTDILEKASGKSYKELLYNNIVSRAGMLNTFPGKNKYATSQRNFSGYYLNNNFILQNSLFIGKSLTSSSGMASTTIDLCKYIAALNNNILISSFARKMLFQPFISLSGKNLPYGLGWFVSDIPDTRVVWHTGLFPGSYSAFVLFIPKTRLTFVILANSQEVNMPFDLHHFGNILRSPFITAFLRIFHYEKITGIPLVVPYTNFDVTINQNISKQITQNDNLANIYAHEIIGNGLALLAVGKKTQANALFKAAVSMFPQTEIMEDPINLLLFMKSGDDYLKKAAFKISSQIIAKGVVRNRQRFLLGLRNYFSKNKTMQRKAINLFKILFNQQSSVEKRDLAWVAYFLGEYYLKHNPDLSRFYWRKAVDFDPGYNRIRRFIDNRKRKKS